MSVRNIDLLKQDVMDQLNWDQRIDAANIEVDTQDRIVELSGWVPTHAMRQAAEDTVLDVAGTIAVNNQLKVRRENVEGLLDDDELTASVKMLLGWHPLIDAGDIHIIVDGGWLTLTGTIDAFWKKKHIESMVSEITGITGLTNKLAITPRDDVADNATAQDILAALDRHTTVDVNDINVRVEKGVVTLSGQVPSSSVYRAAEKVAAFTFGVLDVINNLQLSNTHALQAG